MKALTSPRMDTEEIVETYHQRLFAFAMSLARNEANASDLVQQTYLQWMRKGHQLRDPSKVKSWLFTTLYRLFLRETKRRDAVNIEDIPEPTETKLEADPRESTESRLVQEALAELKEDYRAPLSLFYLEGYKYREIAKILGIEIGTVMSRLHRGRDQLREKLGSRLGTS